MMLTFWPSYPHRGHTYTYRSLNIADETSKQENVLKVQWAGVSEGPEESRFGKRSVGLKAFYSTFPALLPFFPPH